MSELYENAVCLAPMVRSNTLPLRLISLRYGADLVYGEEVVDKSIISSNRVQNALLDTVDFVSPKGGVVVFRTCSEEKSKVVFQIGTADPVLALQAAEKVTSDVASVDINMGCPKHFSTQGGMGAALLRTPEVACDIIKTLRRNLDIPVSCKIRIQQDTQATIDVAKCLEHAGAAAIGVHGRQVHERPSDSAHWDVFAPVVSSLSIPVLVNGDIFLREDIDRVRAISGASSFLIARGALSNASIFRKESMLPYSDVVVEYLKAAAETDNLYHNTKYNLARMIPTKCSAATTTTDTSNSPAAEATVADLHAIDDNRQMFALWDLQNFYDQTQDRFRARALELGLSFGGTDESFREPAHKHDEAFVASQQFYCNTCHVQLSNDKEVAMHTKGKKHKSKLRNAALYSIAV